MELQKLIRYNRMLLIFSLASIILQLSSSVNGVQLRTVFGTLDPPMVSQRVRLNLMAKTINPVPQDGYFTYLFPESYPTDIANPSTACILQQPPNMVGARCTFKRDRSTDNRLLLTVDQLETQLDQFFQLTIVDFMSPRSTTPSSTFEFKSFGNDNRLIDWQTKGVEVQATETDPVEFLTFTSSSQEVADRNQKLTVSFKNPKVINKRDQIKVILPKWNPKSQFPQSYIEDADLIVCSAANFNAWFMAKDCSINQGEDDDNDTIMIEDPFSGNDEVPVEELISFVISPFRNPTSGRMHTGFTVIILDEEGGQVMSGSAGLTVTQYAQVDSKYQSLSASNLMVNAYATYKLEVNLPMPLESGCIVDIEIPKNVVFDQELTWIEVYGIFGYQRKVQYSIIGGFRIITIKEACIGYREASNPAVVIINQLKNPRAVMETGSFIMRIRDMNQNPIAMTEKDGLVLTPTPALSKFGKWYPSAKPVNSESDIQISFQPQNDFSTKAMVSFTFEEDFLGLPYYCEFEGYNYLVNKETVDCKVPDDFLFEVSYFLKEPYSLEDDSAYVQFTIADFTMPSSTRPTGMVTMRIYDIIGDRQYLVEQVSQSNLVQATPGELTLIQVLPTVDETYARVDTQFSFTIKDKVEIGGFYRVTLPKEMSLDQNYTTCFDMSVEEAFCFVNATTNTIQVNGSFIDYPGYEDTEFYFTATEIKTPRASQQTSDFIFQTFDAYGYVISENKIYNLQPLQPSKKLINGELTMEDGLVADKSALTYKFQSPIPLTLSDYFSVTLPQDLGQRLAFTYDSCDSDSLAIVNGNVTEPGIVCMLQGFDELQIFQVPKKLAQNEIYSIPMGTDIHFQIKNVNNPLSMKPSDLVIVHVYDKDGNPITDSGTESPSIMRITASVPNKLEYAYLSQDSEVPNVVTIYKFDIVTRTILGLNSQILVQIPSDLRAVADRQLIKCTVSTKPEFNNPCTFSGNDTHGFINLPNINDVELNGGKAIVFEIDGFVNPKTVKLTKPFKIFTTDADGFKVDASEDSENLMVQSQCNYPCDTCASLQEPDTCRTCQTTSAFPLYYNSKCLGECPQSYYPMGGICSQCNEACLECSGENNICTKCHPGFFLSQNTCMQVCPDGWFADQLSGTCQQCELPCETCVDHASKCTSCNQKEFLSFYFDFQCYEACPDGVSIESLGHCWACDPNCQTCKTSTTQCVTCGNVYPYLDVSGQNQCVAQCPEDTSVATTYDFMSGEIQLKQCAPCDEKCLTCSPTDANQCTKCRSNYKFVESNGVCAEQCPPATSELYIPLTDDTICLTCATGCSECSTDRNVCQACDPGYFLLDTTCMPECPINYIVKDKKKCIRDPKVVFCDYGFEFINGNCTLTIPHCEEGYVLNEKDNMCIPVPEFQYPGIVLLLCFIWTLIIVICGKCLSSMGKETLTSRELQSQLLIGYSLIQQAAYLVMFALSYHMGYEFVQNLVTFAMGTQFLLNIFASFTYLYLLNNDLPHKYWREHSFYTFWFTVVVSFVFSFKAMRWISARFFEWGGNRKYEFDSPFEDRFRHLQRPLSMFTFAQTILQAIPFAVVSIYLFFMIPIWAYQVRTMGIETTIIQIVISILELKEYSYWLNLQAKIPAMNQLVGGRTPYKAINAKGRSNEMRVRSNFEDDEFEGRQSLMKQSRKSNYKMTSEEANGVQTHQSNIEMAGSEVDILKNIIQRNKNQENFKKLDKCAPIVSDIGEETVIKAKKVQMVTNASRQGFEQHRYKTQKEFTEKEVVHGIQNQKEPSVEVVNRISGFFMDKNLPQIVKDKIDFYEKRSPREQNRDEKEFKIHQVEQKSWIEHRKKPNKRRCRSFDENILRELYDDMCPESDYDSVVGSFISFPPRENYLQDEYQMARYALFAEKIKSKFQFNNVYQELAVETIPTPRIEQIAVRTQTAIENNQNNDTSKDPFESDEDDHSKEEVASVIESQIVNGIFGQVYDAMTMGVNSQNMGSQLQSARSLASIHTIDRGDLYMVKAGSSKKRTRKDVNLMVLKDNNNVGTLTKDKGIYWKNSATNIIRKDNTLTVSGDDLADVESTSPLKQTRTNIKSSTAKTNNFNRTGGAGGSLETNSAGSNRSSVVVKQHLDQPVPHQSLLPASMVEARDETIRQLENNSEEAVQDELRRLEELSMDLELDKAGNLVAHQQQDNDSQGAKKDPYDLQDSQLGSINEDLCQQDNQFDRDVASDIRPLSMSRSKLRQKIKRENRMEKAYGPDLRSIDFMQNQSLVPIHRITKLSPKVRPVTAAIRRNNALQKSPDLNVQSDAGDGYKINNNGIPSSLNLIPMRDNLRVNNLVQNQSAQLLKKDHNNSGSSPGTGPEDEMLSSAVGGSSMDRQTRQQQNKQAEQCTTSEWKGQSGDQEQHFLNQPHADSEIMSHDSNFQRDDNAQKLASSNRRESQRSEPKIQQEQRFFDKFEHGYLFDMYRPVVEEKTEADKLRNRGGPEPFQKDDYHPFKSQKTIKKEKDESKQNNALHNQATKNARLRSLENNYLLQSQGNAIVANAKTNLSAFGGPTEQSQRDNQNLKPPPFAGKIFKGQTTLATLEQEATYIARPKNTSHQRGISELNDRSLQFNQRTRTSQNLLQPVGRRNQSAKGIRPSNVNNSNHYGGNANVGQTINDGYMSQKGLTMASELNNALEAMEKARKKHQR